MYGAHHFIIYVYLNVILNEIEEYDLPLKQVLLMSNYIIVLYRST